MMYKISVAIQKKKVFTEHVQTKLSKNLDMYQQMCINIPPVKKKSGLEILCSLNW